MSNFQFTLDPHSQIGQLSNPDTIETAYFDLNKSIASLTYLNGDIYFGQIEPKTFKREGFGQYSFKNGGYYEGEFHDNEFEGMGMLYYKNQDIFQGIFKSGLREGFGVYRYSSDLIFSGYFHNDLQEGVGILKNTVNGWEFKGSWKRGLREGVGVYDNSRDGVKLVVLFKENEIKSVKKK